MTQDSELSDYQIQRHPAYRAMRDRRDREIRDLRTENRRLREGLLGKLTARDIRQTPEYQQMRDWHHALKAKNEELRRELAQVLPTKHRVQRSDAYRELRAKYNALMEEAQVMRREFRKGRWNEQARDLHAGRVAWAMRTLREILPSADALLEPEEMIDWHVIQAALWAEVAGQPLGAVLSKLRWMRQDGLDPLRNYREEYGHIPAALRRKILHEEAECAQCGATKDLTIDHIIPLLHGGTSAEDNLQVLCRRHNSQKGARLAAQSNGSAPAPERPRAFVGAQQTALRAVRAMTGTRPPRRPAATLMAPGCLVNWAARHKPRRPSTAPESSTAPPAG